MIKIIISLFKTNKLPKKVSKHSAVYIKTHYMNVQPLKLKHETNKRLY